MHVCLRLFVRFGEGGRWGAVLVHCVEHPSTPTPLLLSTLPPTVHSPPTHNHNQNQLGPTPRTPPRHPPRHVRRPLRRRRPSGGLGRPGHVHHGRVPVCVFVFVFVLCGWVGEVLCWVFPSVSRSCVLSFDRQNVRLTDRLTDLTVAALSFPYAATGSSSRAARPSRRRKGRSGSTRSYRQSWRRRSGSRCCRRR